MYKCAHQNCIYHQIYMIKNTLQNNAIKGLPHYQNMTYNIKLRTASLHLLTSKKYVA